MEKWNKIFDEPKRRLLDNAVAESFFPTIKTELIYQKDNKQENRQNKKFLNIQLFITTELDYFLNQIIKDLENYENERKLSKLSISNLMANLITIFLF